MPLHYVEYGPHEGAVSSVWKGGWSVSWVSCVWTQCQQGEVCCVASLYFDLDSSGPADKMEESVYSLLRDYMFCGKAIPASVHHIFTFALHLYVFTLTFCREFCTKRISCRYHISSTTFLPISKMQPLSNILGTEQKRLPHSQARLSITE